MKNELTKERLLEFLKRLGKAALHPGNCYLTGGASAVFLGWRDATIDIDLKFDPEPGGVFDAIPQLKKDLALNVELAAPDNFIPALKGWQERSPLVGQYDKMTVYNYDFLSQALAKIERGHDKDVADVKEMLNLGLFKAEALLPAFDELRSRLKRYPALDESVFEGKIKEFLRDLKK